MFLEYGLPLVLEKIPITDKGMQHIYMYVYTLWYHVHYRYTRSNTTHTVRHKETHTYRQILQFNGFFILPFFYYPTIPLPVTMKTKERHPMYKLNILSNNKIQLLPLKTMRVLFRLWRTFMFTVALLCWFSAGLMRCANRKKGPSMIRFHRIWHIHTSITVRTNERLGISTHKKFDSLLIILYRLTANMISNSHKSSSKC